MYLKLYNEGALQVARDFRFQVLQGMCVGGSTVVNNAICFDPPRRAARALGRPPASTAPGSSGPRARCAGGCDVQPAPADVYNPAGALFAEGSERSGSTGASTPLEVNIADCLGCGYCNIGCALRAQALDARHGAARGPVALRRPPAGACRLRWRPGSSTTGAGAPSAVARRDRRRARADRRRDRRRRGRGGRLELAAAAQRARRAAGRAGPLLQHDLAADGRLRRA